jgi:hypothetical protein
MLKRILIACCLFMGGFKGMAQQHYHERPSRMNTYSDDEPFGKGFQKEHLFIGGNLGLGFDRYSFSAGISPELGYSYTSWLDAGVLVNFNYNSIRADPYYNDNIRQRSFNYGAGVFARIYPLPFLFLQVSPEYNWIDYNLKDMSAGAISSSYNFHTSAMSLLTGIGYGQRIVGRSSFHISVLIDLLNNPESPYRDRNGTIIPVIKTGFDIYFHPKKH